MSGYRSAVKGSFSRVWSVAKNTFTEAIRDRVLYSLFLFAALMILSSLVIASISAEQYGKIVKDIGLAAISVIGIMISVFLGMGLVFKEIDKRTVYNIFSKPVRRFEFILGKFFGLSFTLFVNTLAMAAVLTALVLLVETTHGGISRFYYGGSHYPQYFTAIYFEYLEFLVLVALAILFSTFTTPVMTVLLCFLTFAAGRFASDVRLFAEEVKAPLAKAVTQFVYVVLPHLDALDMRAEAVYGGHIGWRYAFLVTCYVALYTAALLFLSIVIFNKREFK